MEDTASKNKHRGFSGLNKSIDQRNLGIHADVLESISDEITSYQQEMHKLGDEASSIVHDINTGWGMFIEHVHRHRENTAERLVSEADADNVFDSYANFVCDYLNTDHAFTCKWNQDKFPELVGILLDMCRVAVMILRLNGISQKSTRRFNFMVAEMIAYANFYHSDHEVNLKYGQVFANMLRPLHALASVRIRPGSSVVPA